MTYDLEALGEDRFQMLCQSILAATYPNVQCLPINQPDGGRDAFLRTESGFVIFQVKFSRRPSEKSERDAVESLIKTEKLKVDALIGRGASSYVLLTNISGTSHLDVGSIDRIQTELSAAFGIPTMCWWRDDLERRIDGIEGLIWRYPELIRSVDFLETIASRSIDSGSRKALAVFRAYMEAQFVRDSEVKFQQVQIQNLLLDLFTDTPLAFAREKQPKPLMNACDLETFGELSFPSGQHSQHYFPHRQNKSLAADWLLRAAPSSGLQRIILEGAPGQGKSTVTQYVCQVNRIKSHPDYLDEKRIPTNHFDHIVRLPFRVDLRDYSTWLSGYDPFAGSKAVPRAGSAVDTLESFVSHQIRYLSGGMSFDVDMFSHLISDAHCLIVLDGFDEVADIPTRVRIIEQTRLFAGRVQGIVKSAQLIVTSRPNAFILSSGFPEREWMHLSLRPLQTVQISEYADKWIAAKELTPIKGAEFKELLGDRVSRPHIRSLAQNPMQLAILLNLINTKGLSLPDKRTALYESYMDLFFGREAEKDEVVRENRDVLMQIHEYVAWLLQTDAERPGGAGSMTQTNLEQVVQAFLSKKGHEVDVLSLFQGAVERVGALVSRVQGMIEFEVQPLREFFAGRYLYVSAPYSTMVDERGGSRPRRFAALARRPYWSNVARFYAGCYNSGELASLLQGLEEVYEESSEAVKSHALQLGLLLLSDWVFAQEPRIVTAVVTFLTARRSFERLVSTQTSWEESRLALPTRSGRVEMGSTAINEVINSVEAGYIARVGEVAVLNSSYAARLSAWKSHDASSAERVRKASALGLFSGSTRADLASFIAEFGISAIEEAIVAGRWDDLSTEEIGLAINSAAIRLGTVTFRIRDEDLRNEKSLLRALWFLTPMNLSLLKYDNSPDLPFSQVMNRYGFPFLWGEDDELSSAAHLGLSDFTAACERAAGCDLGSWMTTLKPWSDVVESARRTWGQTLPVMTLAASAAGIRSKSVRSNDFDDLFAAQMPLSERARHARLRTTSIWWADQWTRVKSQEDLQWITLVALAWATGPVLKASVASLSSNLDGMTAEEFDHFSRALDTVMIISPGGRPRLTGIDIDYISSLGSARLAFALGARLGEAARRKVNSSLAKRNHIDDAVLLSRLFGWFVSYAYREPAMWDEAVKLLTAHGEALREHERQTRRPVKATYLGGRSAMPQKLAETFLRTANYRPMVLLDAAASSVRQAQGADRRPLGEVAAAERWFTE